MEVLSDRGARSVRSAVLLHKQRPHQVPVRPDFVAFEIPDEFVVGYGLDYRELLRNLPYLAVLEPSDLERIDDISPLTRLSSEGSRPVREHG
jgi:hypoxanthine phosphoribosyltransferase